MAVHGDTSGADDSSSGRATPVGDTRATGHAGAGDPVEDVAVVDVPVGGRVTVVSDLHLTKDPTAALLAATTEIATAIAAATGPGAVVLAGNTFESGSDPRAALNSHGRLAQELRAYANAPGRTVVLLPGQRDAALAWSDPFRRAVSELLGAKIALRADLRIETGAGLRKVRVDPGRGFDPLSRPVDPRNPLDSPFAHHIRAEVLPSVRSRTGSEDKPAGWLAGLEQLDDPGAVSRFIASRLVYRRLAHFGWLLLLPVVLAVLLRLPATAFSSARHGGLTTRLGLLVLATVVELLLLVAVAFLATRATGRALAAVAVAEPDKDPNEEPRAAARALVNEGWAGLISGHTCRPALTPLGDGFYANCGAAAEVVSEHPTRVPGLGLPSVFLSHRLLSWVELEAGNDLHVRLLHARQDLPGASVFERVLAERQAPSGGDLRPSVAATFPKGSAWPPPLSPQNRDRRVRRASAAGLVAVGFLSLVSAMSDPLRDRIDVLRSLYPIAVPETAAAIAAFVGVALIVLARGVRRGQRRAWAVCEVLLIAVAVAHVVKGIDVEEALLALVAAGVLWVYRASFQARTDVVALRRGLLNIFGAFILTVIAGTVAVELSTSIERTRRRVSWAEAAEAALLRMVGSGRVPLPHRIDAFLAPAMATAAAGLVLALIAVLFRPVVSHRHRRAAPAADTSADPDRMARARAVIARHGSGTLDYFALRPDKDFFFWGDTVVAHAVYGGVCLVSPDPVGPPAEREEAWKAFRRYVDERGWALGGLGAGEEWLPIYRASGMRDLYVGDEAVVRVGRFTLEGGRFKGLRQAVNRVSKYGYRITFHDPAHLDPGLRTELEDVMTKSRRGDVERGFSMTLGRVFDPEDEGLLLAVVHGPSETGLGRAVAFCHYVPAPGIGGYSLDLMRRDPGDHPNGLIDFAVVETIRELAARGQKGLGLNFATMRAVLAGEAGEGVTQRVQAWLLRRMGGSMQIESLWKFNAKFDPDWQPRYAVYDAPENMLAVAIAVARAESFWELPVIGRFLVPS